MMGCPRRPFAPRQEELGGDRVKWRYRLKLRNTTGVALTLTLTNIYTGRDATGRPIQVRVPVALDRFLPRRDPALLDFTRSIAGTVSGHVHCQTMPPEVQVFDPDRHDAGHFLIAIDNVRRRVQARTRWIDPAGGEVKVRSQDTFTFEATAGPGSRS